MGVCSLCDNSFSDGFIVSLFFCHVRCTSTNKYNLKREREVTGFFFSPQAFHIENRGEKKAREWIRSSGGSFPGLEEVVHRRDQSVTVYSATNS